MSLSLDSLEWPRGEYPASDVSNICIDIISKLSVKHVVLIDMTLVCISVNNYVLEASLKMGTDAVTKASCFIIILILTQ
jgi:hypothetical protein